MNIVYYKKYISYENIDNEEISCFRSRYWIKKVF